MRRNGYDTEKQYDNSIHINQMHFISGNPWRDDENDMKITFKNRHTPEFFNATLHRINEDEYLICTEAFNIDNIHFKGKFTLCNWILKWQKKYI